MKFEYSPDVHEYRLDGRRLLSNTEILSALGFSDYSFVDPFTLETAAQLGTDVHKATELMDKNKPWAAKYGNVAGYVEAYKLFKKDFEFKPALIEVPMYDPFYGVATCPDRHGLSCFGEITVQLKTCAVKRHVALQTAYEERCIRVRHMTPMQAAQDHRPSSDRRFAIELRADGKYKPTRFDRPGYENDIKVYLGAITLAQWLRNDGRI